MAAYAGIVDNVDQNVGRLVEFMQDAGRWDNTLFIFLSDNGASPYINPRFSNRDPWDVESRINPGLGWANADNTPFAYFKQNQHEGGISTPAIVHGASFIEVGGRIDNTVLHVMDVLPTLLDVANVSYPESFPGRKVRPPSGRSFLPLLKGEQVKIHDELFFQYSINRALRAGDWKLVSARQGPWELYNLKEDRSETTNLASQYPERVEAMKVRWHEMAKTETKVSGKYLKPLAEQPDSWQEESQRNPRVRIPGDIYEMGGENK